MADRKRGRLRRALFVLAATGLAVPLAAGFFGEVHPALDSFAHFRAHLAVLAVGLAALGLVVIGRAVATGAALLLVLAAWAVWTVAPYAARPGQAGEAGEFTLLQMNVLSYADPSEAVERIGRLRPDFVTLQEARPSLLKGLEAAGDAYPHVATCAVGPGAGLVILSRHPFGPDEARCDPRHGYMARRVALPGGGVTIASQHLRWPWPYSQWFHIDALAPALAEAGSPLVIGGDFNAVPWSAAVESYAAASGTEAVGGIGPTWLHPSLPGRWRRVVGLPIDNILVSPGVTITAVSRPMATASDHLPVLVAFRRRERR